MPRSHQAPQNEWGGFRQGFQGSLDGSSASPLLSFAQGLCREIIGWKHLSHPNILPLLGVSVSTDPYSFRIITKWMPNESVTRYARSNPKANRLRLVYPITIPHKFYFIHHRPLAVRGCIWCDVPSQARDSSRRPQRGKVFKYFTTRPSSHRSTG